LHTVIFPDHRVDFSFESIIIEIRDKIQYADDIDVEDNEHFEEKCILSSEDHRKPRGCYL